MKTCNFGGAQPRLFGANNDEPEGILCAAQPIARYGMIPCYDRNCFLCQPRRRGGKGSEQVNATVHFCPKQAHQFVNKYEAILNCDAVSDLHNYYGPLKSKNLMELSFCFIILELYHVKCNICFDVSLWWIRFCGFNIDKFS